MNAAAFESAVLHAAGIREDQLDFEKLGRAYASLSDALNAGAKASSFLVRSDDAAIVFGVVYAARTYHAARRIFAEHPPSETFTDLGAGWGPLGLAAAEHGARITLVDRNRKTLERAEALFDAAGQTRPETRAGEAAGAGRGSIGLAFAWTEMEPPLRHWLRRLGNQDRLYVLEPGTRKAARRLQSEAERHQKQVLAPCAGAPTCPLLQNEMDWCHFTWRFTLGPIARAVAEQAKRRWQEQHVSYLVLQPAAVEHRGLRVLSVRREGKAKASARCCGPQGLVRISALRRHEDAHSALLALEPGAVIEVDGAAVDGIRLGSPAQLRLLHG